MPNSTTTKSADNNTQQHTPDTNFDATPCLRLLGQWNMEISALYRKRLQEYCMFPFNLMLCTSPDAVADAQEKFSRTLMADYTSAAQKLVRAVEFDSRSNQGASEDYAASLLKAQEDARKILDQAKAQAQRIMDTAAASVDAEAPDSQAVAKTRAA